MKRTHSGCGDAGEHPLFSWNARRPLDRRCPRPRSRRGCRPVASPLPSRRAPRRRRPRVRPPHGARLHCRPRRRRALPALGRFVESRTRCADLRLLLATCLLLRRHGGRTHGRRH
jgi:hypothetical protein